MGVLSWINAAAVDLAAGIGWLAIFLGPALVASWWDNRVQRVNEKYNRPYSWWPAARIWIVLQVAAVWLYLNGHAILRAMASMGSD